MPTGDTQSSVVKERASVMFGRQSTRKKKPVARSGEGCFSCLSGAFASLMGFPESTPEDATAYGAPQPLAPVTPCVQWAELPSERKVGVKQVEVLSSTKEYCAQGWINQDATAACAAPEGEACKDGALYFCVFDGHGKSGHEVARIASERLPAHLAAFSDGPLSNPQSALQVAFQMTDDDIYASMGQRVEYSGSTGVAVMMDPAKRELHLGNVGDSRCILGRCTNGVWSALPLTKDLKPDLPEERHRIELSGGTVMALEGDDGRDVGPARVWDSAAREKPGLAVSRSLGDGASRCLGVIAEPVVTRHQLRPEDRFILIATDGLWDTIHNDKVVEIVSGFLDRNLASVAVKALTNKVRSDEDGELVDDTTMVLVSFS